MKKQLPWLCFFSLHLSFIQRWGSTDYRTGNLFLVSYTAVLEANVTMHTETGSHKTQECYYPLNKMIFIVWISHIDSGQSDQPGRGRRLWGKF